MSERPRQRDARTGNIIETDDATASGLGSVMMTLRVRPGLRAFVFLQAKHEKIRPYQLLRRCVRWYLQSKISTNSAFFQVENYNLDEQEFSSDIRREIKLSETEISVIWGGRYVHDVRRLTADIERLNNEIADPQVTDIYRRHCVRMRDRYCYQLGGRQLVLETNGYDYKTLNYLLRALNRGDFPFYKNYTNCDDFLLLDIHSPSNLAMPDERYAAEDERHGVHYEPDGHVWASRPIENYKPLSRAQHDSIFNENKPFLDDLEAETNYDPKGTISQG